jgi:hypothetical protein
MAAPDILEAIVRVAAFFLPFLVFLSIAAQVPAQTPPHGAPRPQVSDQSVYVAQDGGTRQILESIVIQPKPNAPFISTLQTEWLRNLADGGTITLVNERRIMRDTKGRIYQERWYLVPKNSDQHSAMTAIQISDPNNHTLYTYPMETHVCELTPYGPTPATVYQVSGPATGPLPNDAGFAIHEDLGKQLIAGVDTVGTRESTIYNPGVFGNDRKVTVSREFWYAPQLGINLLSKRSDPRFGTQTFTVTNLSLAEPDPQLFELPEGFRVEDRRPAEPPATPPAN